MLPGQAYSFTIQKHCEYDACGCPAIDVVRRHYGVNHLHEPGRSLDYSSDSSFSHCLVGRIFFAISDIRMVAFGLVDYGVSSTRGFTP